MMRWWCRLALNQTFTILTKYTFSVSTYLHHFDNFNPLPFWHFCTALTILQHFDTEIQEKSEQTMQRNIWISRAKQAKRVHKTSANPEICHTQNIVIVKISVCAINRSLHSTFGEELLMNFSRLLGCKRTNEYSRQSNRSEITRLMSYQRYSLWLGVTIDHSSLCLHICLLRSIIREAFVVCTM